MQSNTSEVENCFDSICAPAKRKSVFVEKSDQIDTVILSADHYRALQVTQTAPVWLHVRKSLKLSLATGLPRKTTG
jgi:hypothetical protein